LKFWSERQDLNLRAPRTPTHPRAMESPGLPGMVPLIRAVSEPAVPATDAAAEPAARACAPGQRRAAAEALRSC